MTTFARRQLNDSVREFRPHASAPVTALTAEDIEHLRSELDMNPSATLLVAPAELGPDPTAKEGRALLTEVERLLASPESVALSLQATESAVEYELPHEHRFPGYDSREIPIHLDKKTFEQRADWEMWALTAAAAWRWRSDNPKPPFRRHSAANRFEHPLQPRDEGGELKVALFSDWGTGYYHSRYIAKHIRDLRPSAAIHLGDVYYTGTSEEFKHQVEPSVEPMLRVMPLYSLNANHEMDSNGIPYFEFLDWKHEKGGTPGYVTQPQVASYFCLISERYRILGIDTAFFANGRHNDLASQAWLADRLREGRRAGQINILLSQNEPYSRGEDRPSKLLASDLREVVPDVDIWFWGDEHYAALYGPAGDEIPFFGSCIGHGGFPYYTLNKGDASTIAPMIWEETGTRFPEVLSKRRDMGSNGWCLLGLGPQALTVTYYDWMRRERKPLVFDTTGNRLRLVK